MFLCTSHDQRKNIEVSKTMIIRSLVVGPLENNCYVIEDEKNHEAFITDPGDEPDRIIDLIQEYGLKIKYIICTHAHFDHIAAISELKEETRANIIIHKDDLDLYENAPKHALLWGFEIAPLPEPDVLIQEGDTISIGELQFTVFHTPGHSPGGICIYGNNIIITGDTLFAGSVGRTDLPGGDISQLRKSFNRLMTLPADTEVLPGHGPETTIGREKTENFFASG